jgi:hypothetical protein
MSLDADYFSIVLDTVKAKLDGNGIEFISTRFPEPPSNTFYELRVERYGQHGSRYVFSRFIPISSLRTKAANELAEQFFEEAVNALGNVGAMK